MSWHQTGDKRNPIDLRFGSSEKSDRERLFPSSSSSSPSIKWLNRAAAEELKAKDSMTDRPFQQQYSSSSSSGGHGDLQFTSSASSSRFRSNNNEYSPGKYSKRIEKRREHESQNDDWLDKSLNNQKDKTTTRHFAMDFNKLKQKEEHHSKERFLNVMSYGGFDSSNDVTYSSRIKKRKQFDEDLDEVVDVDVDKYSGPDDSKRVMRGVSVYQDDDFEDDQLRRKEQQGGKPRRKKPNQSSTDTLHSATSADTTGNKKSLVTNKQEEESEWIDTTSIAQEQKDKPYYDVWNKPNQQKELKVSSSSYGTVENKEWDKQLRKMKQQKEQARDEWLAKQAQKNPPHNGGGKGDTLQFLGASSDTLYAQGGTDADLDPLEDPNYRASDFSMPVGTSFDPYAQKGNKGTTTLPANMSTLKPINILAMMRKNQSEQAIADAVANKGKDTSKESEEKKSMPKTDWSQILKNAQKTRQAKITTSLEQIDLGPLVMKVLQLDLSDLLQKSQKIHQEKDDMDVALEVENYDAAHNLILTDVEQFDKTKLRYINEQAYNGVFEPLLIEETCAAIVSQMHMDDNRSRKSHQHRTSNRSNKGESAPKYDMEVEHKCVELETIRIKKYVTSRLHQNTSPRDGSPAAAAATSSQSIGELVTLEATPSLTSHRQRGYFPAVPSLAMDEMCILMKDKPSIDRHSKDYYKTLLSTPHVLGLISKSKQKILWEPESASSGINSGSDQRQFQVYDITVFNAGDLVERHNTKTKHNASKRSKTNNEGVLFHVVPLMSLSTFIREWEAIQCMKLPELMPLSSYIRNGTPIVSALLLMDMKAKLENHVNQLIKVSADKNAKDADMFRLIEKLREQIMNTLHILRDLPVDGSVVIAGGNIGKYIAQLHKKEGMKQHREILEQCSVLKNDWMTRIKAMHKTSTISKLSGGNTVVIERSGKGGGVGSQGANAIVAPLETPPLLWKTLTETFNESQLYSIKHVCTRFTDERDTRIALLQGPPGTGKTSTILGMLSVFLSKKYNSEGVLKSANRTLTPTSTANNNDTRILLCAPSNAALDELLLRILRDGIVNGKGVKQQVRIVRLGESQKPRSTSNDKMSSTDNNIGGKDDDHNKPSSGPLKNATMDDVASLALEEQIELRVRHTAEYTENDKLDGDIRKSFRDLTDAKKLEHSMGASEYREMSRKIKTHLTSKRSRQRRLQKLLATMRYDIRRELLHGADIVASTCSSSGRHSFVNIVVQDNIAFQCCIIDEAAQTTEPSTLVPLKYGCANLVLVGDPRQLPATVLSNAASHAGLGMSLFERLEKCGHEVVMLNMQYRMHPILRAFPSLHFYKNQLEDAPYIIEEVRKNDGEEDAMDMDDMQGITSTSNDSKVCVFGPENQVLFSTAAICQSPPQLSVSVLNFYNVNGQERKAGKSFVNESEAYFCIWLANQLLCHFKGRKSIAIIAPYKAQVRYIAKILNEISGAGGDNNHDHRYGPGASGGGYKTSSTLTVHSQFRDLVEVNTVDGFQGREKDIILFTGVRTNARSIGFVSDVRRLNVAITRAKGVLAIVGHTNLGRADETWAAYIEHVSVQGRLIDVQNVNI